MFPIVEKPLFISVENSYDLLRYAFFIFRRKLVELNQNLNIKTGGER